MKKCFKCGEVKALSEFYEHPKMADGHVNKCKTCNKKDVRENRACNIDYYRLYDIERGNRQSTEYLKGYRDNFPNKYKAHSMVNNAVRDGKLSKGCCEVCGDTIVHGHHDNYDEPLNIRWLCPIHHKEWHDNNGPGINGI